VVRRLPTKGQAAEVAVVREKLQPGWFRSSVAHRSSPIPQQEFVRKLYLLDDQLESDSATHINLQREVEILKTIECHPHIIRYHDFELRYDPTADEGFRTKA
jgi:hypothetical protein